MNAEQKLRMDTLINKLNVAAYHYYQLDNEVMSNYEYDSLYDELIALEVETGFQSSNSPTQKVGYEVLSELPKIKHQGKMLSLNKTKSIDDLQEFLGDQEGVLSWKLDGLTIVLTYKDGVLFQALTRGNGEIGEDVTNNAKVFSNIPLKIAYKGELIVRGEAVILYSDFKRINELLVPEEQYKNPRNLCSGSVRQLNNKVTKDRNVHFFGFSLLTTDQSNEFMTRSQQLTYLEQLGFTVVEHQLVNKETIELSVLDYKQRIEQNDFASDGLVLTFDSIAYGQSLGKTAKFPKDAIAFKWQDEIAETTLTGIEWSASRTGLINPVALFDPVELEGTTVARASLHNLSIIEELALGLGDTITVYKANMIIPQVADNMTRSGQLSIPDKCPVCQETTFIANQNGVKSLNCGNPLCLAKQVKSLAHYVSRDAMNIDGLSEATLEKLIDIGCIRSIVDLYQLEQHKEQILQMEGFGEKSYNNLIAAIEKSKLTELPRFIYALGIGNVGLSNARLLVDYFGGDMDLILQAKSENLIAIPGYGEVISQQIQQFFEDANNQENIKRLMTYLTFEPIEKSSSSEQGDIFQGKTFVITGSINNYPNRGALKKEIEGLGGKVTDAVSNLTDYLINNDSLSSSSKNKKAKSLNIPIITEEEYLALKSTLTRI